MQKPALNRQSLLRILAGVYLFPLYLVCFSLGVPPSDLPLCALLFALAVFGLVLARKESRVWGLFWGGALVVSVAFATFQIAATKHLRVAASRPLTVEETHVVEIARQSVATNDTWVDRAEFELPEKKPDGSWRVTVWRMPKEPGGFRDISIDPNGKVTNYYRGY